MLYNGVRVLQQVAQIIAQIITTCLQQIDVVDCTRFNETVFCRIFLL